MTTDTKDGFILLNQVGNWQLRENSKGSIWLQQKHDGGTDNLFMSRADFDDLFSCVVGSTQEELSE